MPRPEIPITWEGPVADLARGLRQLREQAGRPPYRKLAKNTNYSSAVLAAAAAGRQCPTWGVAEAFIRSCGANPKEWRALWVKANAADHQQRSSASRQRKITQAEAATRRSGTSAGPGGDRRRLLPGQPDPLAARTANQYVRQLRALRAWAGQPGHWEITRRPGGRSLPSSTMYDALHPHRIRLPSLTAVQVIVTACTTTAAEAEEWITAWRIIRIRELEANDRIFT
jgi:hypothetical protein